MSYIERAITKNEKLLFKTGAHWIYLLEGLFWFAAIIAAGLAFNHLIYRVTGAPVPLSLFDLQYVGAPYSRILWIYTATGFVIFLMFFREYVSNEIGLTDQRIIHKKGLWFIQIKEVDLGDIRGESIVHGWFGWLLGYGRVRYDCRFINDMTLPAIPRPLRMVKISHEMRRKTSIRDEDLAHDQPAPAQKPEFPPVQKPGFPPVETAREMPVSENPSAPDLQEIERTRRRANLKMKLRIMKDVFKGSFKRAS